ncbi:MAG: hypothetical protein K0B06_11295 [Brevefilum sp.]|nr:hypothetical protein [Brevefilum sp.]
MAKSRCLDYYQNQYHQLFSVHKIEYSSKLPGYVLTLSPENDPQIQFTCNPNCDILCYSDEYGGVLASRLLVEDIQAMIDPSYAHLALQMNAAEDPFTEYGGENPDYFETNPRIRLTKNHQNLSIAWVDPALSREDFDRIAEEIAALIETQLPIINPDLQVTIAVFADESDLVAHNEADFILFTTFDTDQ